MSYDLICSRESIISFLQGCHSSDDGISYDWSVACPSSKKVVMYRNCPGCGFLFYLPMNHGGSLVVVPRGAYHVCLTSPTFSANSSFYEDIVPKDQRTWYSGFKAGLSCSCHKTDNSPAAWPNKATSSMLHQFLFWLGYSIRTFWEMCARFLAFGFPLEDIKRATSRPAHVWDLRRSSWSNKLSAILDLRKIRRFLRFVVTFRP